MAKGTSFFERFFSVIDVLFGSDKKEKPPCKLKDCKYINTEGCRVRGLGVSGIRECVKYKKG